MPAIASDRSLGRTGQLQPNCRVMHLRVRCAVMQLMWSILMACLTYDTYVMRNRASKFSTCADVLNGGNGEHPEAQHSSIC